VNILGNIVATGTTGGVAKLSLVAEEVHGEIEGINIGNNFGGLAFKTNSNGTTAERMRIDSSGNVGVQTNSPNKSSSSTALTVNTSSAANYSALELSSGDTLNWHINANNAAVYDVTAGTRPRVFYTNGSERMRIDSSGKVGIGTSSPSYKFQIAAGTDSLITYAASALNSNIFFDAQNTNTGASAAVVQRLITSDVAGTGSVSADFQKTKAGALNINNNETNSAAFTAFGIGGSERMRITSSGNVGIGASLPAARHEVNLTPGSSSALMDSGTVNDVQILRAPYSSNPAGSVNGGAKWGVRFVGRNDGVYNNLKSAAVYAVSEENSAGYNRAVGLAFHTSGFDQSHSERMRITSGGSVGIGTTSPSAPLHVQTTSQIVGAFIGTSSDPQIYLGDAVSSDNAFIMGYDRADNRGYLTVAGDSDSAFTIINGGDVGIGGLPSQRLHIHGGAVQFTNTQNTYLQINTTDTHLYTAAAHPLRFGTNSTERMRIDSSGNLLVGKTSAASNVVGAFILNSGLIRADVDGGVANVMNRKTSDGDVAIFQKDGATVGSIGTGSSRLYVGTSNVGAYFASAEILPWNTSTNATRDDAISLGNSSGRFDDIFATNGTIQTSDQQEKNTITDSDLGLDFINRLSPKSYIFNGKTRTHYGLIAQDVETVLGDISKPTSGFAGFIKSDISDEQDGSEYRYGLRYTEFVGPLIQAIKDLKAENDAMRARLDALEAN
jgi:hypothetical protein